MPPAKKPASQPPRRSPVAFTEPAALKRLTESLDAAQEALAELRKDTRRDVSKGARDLYNDLRKLRHQRATRHRQVHQSAAARFRPSAKATCSRHGWQKRSHQVCREPFEQDRIRSKRSTGKAR